jgi:hypothetical protein
LISPTVAGSNCPKTGGAGRGRASTDVSVVSGTALGTEVAMVGIAEGTGVVAETQALIISETAVRN